MKKRNIVIITVIVLGLGALLLAPKLKATFGGSATAGTAPAATAGPGQNRTRRATTFTVRSQIVKKEDLQSYLDLNGEIDYVAKLDVFADISGRVRSIEAELGSWVQQGQLLARIDPSRPGERYELSPVYAPVAGRLVILNITEGASVNTQSPLMRIARSDELEVLARVNERDIGALKTGLLAKIYLEAWPGLAFPAKVQRIDPMVDPVSRTKSISLVFDASDPRINAGMFPRIRLNTDLHRNSITIPSQAIGSRYDERFVWLIRDDDSVERRLIVLGIQVDGRSQILEGLAEGERVVTEGSQVLSEGAKVLDVAVDRGEEKKSENQDIRGQNAN